jgi:hypothetical protein
MSEVIHERSHLSVSSAQGNSLGGILFPSRIWALLTVSDLLLRHRQKIHDREKVMSKQSRRPRSRADSMSTAETATQAKPHAPSRSKRRRDSISVVPLPPRNASVSSAPGALQSNSALYMPAPASAPAATNNLFNFNNYPSPSTSTTSTGPDVFDCSMNASYVNPADLFSVGGFPPPQNFATPTSTSPNSSIIPPTPEFSAYIPQFTGNAEKFDLMNVSYDSSAFDISLLMNTLSSPQSNFCPPIDENNMMVDSLEDFSPPQQHYTPSDVTSPASFTTDQNSSTFQFAWQPTTMSHGSNEYNTALPFEPSHSSVSPMDIIMKQDSKLTSANPFTSGALHNAQLFAAFPDGNDVFDLLIDEKEPAAYTRKEDIDSMLRGNLIATIQNAGITVPEIPTAADLSTYVSAYWEYIHPHVPVFFKPGFVAQIVPEGTLLGICALGALTMGAMRHAIAISRSARAVVQKVLPWCITNCSAGKQDFAN